MTTDARPVDTTTTELTAPECAEQAAAALRHAEAIAAAPAAAADYAAAQAQRAEALVQVAAGWVDLAVTLDRHPGLRRRHGDSADDGR